VPLDRKARKVPSAFQVKLVKKAQWVLLELLDQKDRKAHQDRVVPTARPDHQAHLEQLESRVLTAQSDKLERGENPVILVYVALLVIVAIQD